MLEAQGRDDDKKILNAIVCYRKNKMSETFNYSFEVDDTSTRKYQLDVSELYEYPAATAVQPLKTCPLTSEIKQVEAPWSSGNQFVFDTNFGAQQFISNCFKFHFTVPLTITLADTVVNADDITEANFMEKLFGGQEDLCYSQNSIMQALQNLSIDINSQNVFNMSNIAETFNMVSPFYARKDVDEWFHASQPDRFQSFDVYSGKSAQTLKFINEIGQTTYTTLDAE
jgi:hypothetical protein